MIKIPLWSLDRTPNQHKNILRNRYVVILELKELVCEVLHEVLNAENKWVSGYSWCTVGVRTKKLASIWKDEIPVKKFLFGLLKKYDDYYDGPITTWFFGLFYVNYRW